MWTTDKLTEYNQWLIDAPKDHPARIRISELLKILSDMERAIGNTDSAIYLKEQNMVKSLLPDKQNE